MTDEARFVLSKSVLFSQYKTLEDMGLDISYSVKTNPIVAGVLEDETGSSFSVHTKQEMSFVKDKSRIWFLAESWDEQEIHELTAAGIRNFIVYNTNDLDRLMSFLKGKKLKISLLLRAKLRERTIFTERYFVFGMDARTVNGLVHELRKNENIERLGVHFHRKTQNVSEWSLKYELSNMLEPRTLEEIDMVNIGGGLPAKYRNTGDGSLPFIFSKIKELKEWLEEHNIKTTIEPGRFLSGPPIRLEASIKNITENNITVNCSVYNSSMDTIVVPIKLLVEGELHDNEGSSVQKYRIKGCTPCSMDIFRYSVMLPEMKVGDKIVFLNAGAYTFHTDFCGLGKLKTEIVD
jgi:ornithine decarboxylase